MSHRKRVFITEILVLGCIMEEQRSSLTDILRCVNDKIAAEEIPPDRTMMVKQATSIARSLDKLRELGLLSGMEPTAYAQTFMKQLGSDWRDWPVEIPVDNDGVLDWDNARFS